MKMIKNKIYVIVLLEAVLFLLLIFMDQLSKCYIIKSLKELHNQVLIPNFLEFYYVENTGAAFGILQNQKIFFLFITFILSGILIFLLAKIPKERKYSALIVAIILLLSGGIGNAIDRIRFDFVIDFIYVKIIDFPVFNFADLCVTSGSFLILILLLFFYKEQDLEFLSFKQKKYRQLK